VSDKQKTVNADCNKVKINKQVLVFAERKEVISDKLFTQRGK
jgi:hypothetical protein